MRGVALFAILASLLTSCGGVSSSSLPTQAAVETPQPTAACTAAPAWLRKVLQKSLKPKGAKVGKAFIAPATNLDGPPIVSPKVPFGWRV